MAQYKVLHVLLFIFFSLSGVMGADDKEQLITAVQRGELKTVINIVKLWNQEIKPNIITDCPAQDSLLHIAIRNVGAAQGSDQLQRSIQIFNTLLSAGCDVNARNAQGKTPLDEAKHSGGNNAKYLTNLLLLDPTIYIQKTVPELFTDKISRVLSYLEKGEANIGDLTDKDIVIVLGRTQVGKSTTINSLLGAKLVFDDDDKIVLDPSERGNFAEIGGKGLSCTEIPNLYMTPMAPYAFLDTRGLFDVNMNPEGEIAASILTEMAVKKARSVRVMLIEDYRRLRDGVVAFRDLGKTLGEIVVGHEIPILFLFNRYSPPESKALTFYGLPDDKKEKIIQDSINQSIDALLTGEQIVVNGVATKVAEKLGRPFRAAWSFFAPSSYKSNEEIPAEEILAEEISHDMEFQEAIRSVNYTSFVKYNKERGYVGHINPMSDVSKNRIISLLNDLPSVDPTSLVFNGYNTARVEFDEVFAQKISSLLLIMKAKIQISKYSPSILKDLEKELKDRLNRHVAVLESLTNDSSITEDLLESYVTKEEELSCEKQKLKEDIAGNKTKKALLELEIKNILSGDPVLYWTDIWKNEWNFFIFKWWRNHDCIYPKDTNFSCWKAILENKTCIKEIKKDETPNLHVIFTSKPFSNCEGKVEVYVSPKDDPSTAALINVKEQEILALEAIISNMEESLGKLNEEMSKDLPNRVSSKIDCCYKQIDYLSRSIKFYQNAQQLYEEQGQQIALCVRIANKLESKKSVVEEFRKFHGEFFEILKERRGEKEQSKSELTDAGLSKIIDAIFIDTLSGESLLKSLSQVNQQRTNW